MFPSILVPLDGSTFAEQALPLAASIAERNHSVLHLAVVHPWGPSEDAPRPGTQADREIREDAGAYLNRLTQNVAASYQIPVCEAVLDGTSASGALVEHARRKNIDLVVASTHEHGPLWRWISSGVARQLTHRLRASVLFVKPQLGSLPIRLRGFSRLLVALDGSPEAESGLEQALALAAPNAVITLVRVTAHSKQHAEHRRLAAQAYLDDQLKRAVPHGCRLETAVFEGGSPADILLRYAETNGMDLIVLTTRANVSLPRAVLGTVTDRVLHRSPIPVLVCHAAEVPAQVGSGGRHELA
jgi:nucleotide-binding universal stress UspA family protein